MAGRNRNTGAPPNFAQMFREWLGSGRGGARGRNAPPTGAFPVQRPPMEGLGTPFPEGGRPAPFLIMPPEPLGPSQPLTVADEVEASMQAPAPAPQVPPAAAAPAPSMPGAGGGWGAGTPQPSGAPAAPAAPSEEDPYSGLSPELVAQILKTGGLSEELGYAQMLRQTPTPEGRQAGRVYMAGNPLEHIGAAYRRHRGKKRVEKLRPEIEDNRAALLRELFGVGGSKSSSGGGGMRY